MASSNLSYRDYKAQGFNGSYKDYRLKERQRLNELEEAKKQAEKQAEKQRMEAAQKRMDALELQELKNKPDYLQQNNSLKNNNSKLAFDQQKYATDTLLKRIDYEKADNLVASTTTDKVTGEPIVDYKKLADLNAPLNTLYQSLGSGKSQGTAGDNTLSKFQNESPERQAELLNKYKSFKATKTNEWGDDLTKDAPKATTTYQDGNRIWSYPGVKDSKTGEVRGSLSITSPYGSEKEYQNKGGVVGQNPDGSWIWDKNVKSGSGGGFFQRGGLSDLGHALAGDAPRQVERPTLKSIGIDESKQLIPGLKTVSTEQPEEWSASLPEVVKENFRRSVERQKLFNQPKIKNNEIPTNETMSQELRRLQQSDRTPTGAPIAKAQPVTREQMDSLNPYKNGVISKLKDIPRNLNEKYKPRALKDYVNNLFGDPKLGVLSDEDYTRSIDSLNNYMNNWSR